MEVIRSTNIVFNTTGGRQNVDDKVGPYIKKPVSPTEPKTPKVFKSPPKHMTNGVKSQPLDSPVKSHGFPPVSRDEAIALGGSPLFKPSNKAVDPFSSGPVLDTPLSWKKYESPADSGIELSPISVSPSKVNPKIRTMYNNSRRETDENTEFSINPDPVPYQPSNFMAERFSKLDGSQLGTGVPPLSSTQMKKVPVARRHFDTFGSFDMMTGLAKRGMMLHTDRYQWDIAKALDGLNQRERLQAELEYMERLRGIKRRREVLPHRAQLDLLMGGKKMEFTERFEIQREIQKLKSLILPQHAKDLFHGRGFILPEHHNSMKPRRALPADIDFEEDLNSPFSPDKYSYNPETGRVHPKQRQYPADQAGSLPKINNRGYLLGAGAPIILSKERRTVESIKARLRIPTSASQPAYMTRSKTNVPTSGIVNPGVGPGGMRSVTAGQLHKKEYTRPTVTAATTKKPSTTPAVTKPEIKIPVSARDPDEPEMLPEPTPIVPKTTPSNTTLTDKNENDLVVEAWPDVEDGSGTVDHQSVKIGRGDNDSQAPPSRHSASRSIISPVKTPTPNPLKGVELTRTMSEDEQMKLKQTFNKLDTDKDGHIMFSQLQTQLPKQFSQSQEKYIKQVYDITSSNTFFGVDEFMTMSYLTSVVTALRGEPLEAYSKLNFHTLHPIILQYVELFQTVDRSHRGKVALTSLQEILNSALARDFKSEPHTWHKVIDTLELSEPGVVSKIEFLAYIPYFQTLSRRK